MWQRQFWGLQSNSLQYPGKRFIKAQLWWWTVTRNLTGLSDAYTISNPLGRGQWRCFQRWLASGRVTTRGRTCPECGSSINRLGDGVGWKRGRESQQECSFFLNKCISWSCCLSWTHPGSFSLLVSQWLSKELHHCIMRMEDTPFWLPISWTE